jgi:hypothetical protein
MAKRKAIKAKSPTKSRANPKKAAKRAKPRQNFTFSHLREEDFAIGLRA